MTEFEIKSALKKTRGNVQAAVELLASVKRGPDGEEKKNLSDPEELSAPEELEDWAQSFIPKNGLERDPKKARTEDRGEEEPTIKDYEEIAGDTEPDDILAVNAEESEPETKFSLDAPPSMQHMKTISKLFLPDDPNLRAQYEGSYIQQWGWLLWLQEHLPDDTLCVYTSKTNHGYNLLYIDIEPMKQRFVSPPDVEKHLFILPEFYEQVKECRATEKPRFVIGILNLPRHANALVFDFDNTVISRFEPHGGGKTTRFPAAIIDSAIRRHLILGEGLVGFSELDEREKNDEEKNMFQDWTYNSPIDFCPVLGVQTKERISKLPLKKENSGFCLAWAMIFMHMRVLNPGKTEREVVEYFLEKEPDDLARLISKYAAFMVSASKNRLKYEQVYKQGDWVALLAEYKLKAYGRVVSYDKETTNYSVVVFEWSRNTSDFKIGWLLAAAVGVKPVTDETVLQTLRKNYDIKIGDYVEYRINNRLEFAGEVLERSSDIVPRINVLVERVYQRNSDIGQEIQVADSVEANIVNLKKLDFEDGDEVNWVTAREGVRVDRGWGEIVEKIQPHIYKVKIRGVWNKDDEDGIHILGVMDLTQSTH